MPVQPGHVDVCQQWIQHATSWCSAIRGMRDPLFQVARLQQPVDEADTPPIVDVCCQRCQQERVIQAPQTRRARSLDEPCCARPAVYCPQGCMASSTFQKSVRVVAELRRKVGVQDEPEHFLHQEVRPGWHTLLAPGALDWRPSIALLAQHCNDHLDSAPRRRVSNGWQGTARGQRTCAPLKGIAGQQVESAVVEQPVGSFQRQSLCALFV